MRRGCFLLSLLFGCFLTAGVVHADLFHLHSGNTIEGQLLEETETDYQIRTYIGEVDLPKAEVERVAKQRSIFDDYDDRVAALDESARAHYELARWCDDHNLRNEYFHHLNAAIEIDPDFEPARKSLGFTKVGDLWVNADKILETQRQRERAEARAARRAARDEAKRIALQQNEWERRIRGIVQTELYSRDPELRQRGLAKLSAIDDPLALGPMFSVMTNTRREAVRAVLLDAIAAYANREAFGYLVVAALEDDDPQLRRRARAHLEDADQDLLTAVLRRALVEDEPLIERRAAEFAADIGALAAVPEMVSALFGQTRRTFVETESYRPAYVALVASRPGIRIIQNRGTSGADHGSLAFHPEHGYYYDPYFSYGRSIYVERRRVTRTVTVYRSEVRDALRRLTGVDYGFDTRGWLQWFQENHPELATAQGPRPAINQPDADDAPSNPDPPTVVEGPPDPDEQDRGDPDDRDPPAAIDD
jgi:hypothetical protein